MTTKSNDRNRASGGRLENVSGELLVRRFSVRQPEMFRVIETVSARQLTSIPRASLCELAQTVMDIDFDNLDGDFIQAGCGAGGAAIVIAHAKRRNRFFSVHDPFEGSPEAEATIRRELAAHRADERLNVLLVPGPYEKKVSADGPLAMIHADCGKYDPMRVLLDRLAPRMVTGAHLIIDDYKSKEGCRAAVDEYFRGKTGFQLVRKSRLHVIRKKNLEVHGKIMILKNFAGEVLKGVAAAGIFAPAAFFFVYVLGTFLFVPTALLNLAAGALFGTWMGFAVVFAASLTSASAGFLAGRHLSRKWLLKKVPLGGKFHALDGAVAERGWNIVVLMRLSGIVPFTLLNYGLGLSKISFRDYFLASAAGMIPGPLLYVYMGSLAGRMALEDGRGPKGPLEWGILAAGFAATLTLGLYSASIVKKALKTSS